MIALGTLFAALTPFHSRKLLYFSMQLLYKPPHLVLFLNNLRVDRTWGSIRNHPFNVAVCGDHLEKLHFKGNFLEFNGDALLLFGSPFDLLQMNVALLLTEADEAIFFQGGHKKLAQSMKEFEVFRGGIPVIEQDRLRLNAFFFKGLAKHISEVVIFCFAVTRRGINAKIQWMIISLIGMN